MRSLETGKCLQMITTYCCHVLEAKEMLTGQQGAGRQHLCVQWHRLYEDMVMDKEGSNRVVAETEKNGRRVKEWQEEAGSLAGRDHSRRQWDVLDEIGSLLTKQSLAKWPSF